MKNEQGDMELATEYTIILVPIWTTMIESRFVLWLTDVTALDSVPALRLYPMKFEPEFDWEYTGIVGEQDS